MATTDQQEPPKLRLIRLPEVQRRTGLSASGIYASEADGGFPRRRRLSPRTSAWLEHEVEAWIAGRPRAVDATPLPRPPATSRPPRSNEATR